MALGLRLLKKLQISRKEKAALGAIFSVGLIKIVFAVVRVVRIGVSATHVNPIWLALWSMIEASVAVVVACLPSFKVLFAHGRRRSEIRQAVTLKKFHARSNTGNAVQPLEGGDMSSATTQSRSGHTGNFYWHDVELDEELRLSDVPN